MVNLLSVVFNSISISALYAIVAIGFTLIFGVGNTLNFAHGALITLGGFGGWFVANELALSPWLGLLAGGLAGGVAGAILYLAVVQFVEDQPVTLLMLTLVVGFLLRHGLRIVFKSGAITIPQVFPGQSSIGGHQFQHTRVFVFAISWLFIGGVFLFVNYTETGKAILATSMSKKGAALVGVDTSRIKLYTWVLAAALAGFAGVLLTMLNTGSWQMGTDPLVLSFAIVVLGGLGSIRGSLVGAYIIGFTETITVSYISTRLAGLSALLLLIVFLLVKPDGLFGREAAN